MQTFLIHEDHAKALQEIAEKISRLSAIMNTPEDELKEGEKAEAIDAVNYMLTDGRCAYLYELMQSLKNALDPLTLAEICAKTAKPPSYIEPERFIPPTYEEMLKEGTDRDRSPIARRRGS